MVARRRVAVTAAGAVVGVGVAVVVTVIVPASAGGGDDTGRSAQRAAATAPEHRAQRQPRPAGATGPATPAPAPGVAAAQAERTARHFLDMSNTLRSNGKPDKAALDTVAQGFAKGEIAASAAEFADNGWRQTGTATVVGMRTVRNDLDATPPAVTVRACVDSSAVRVVGPDGEPVPGYAEQPERVPHLYTMVRSGDRWKVSGHDFPPEPTC